LIIGAMKAGTTSLFDRLATHPQVGMARIKEPDFFVEEKNWHRGLEWYASLFTGTEQKVARGEASTTYTKCTEFSGVPKRIHSVLPDARLVYLLRDPIERIRSMYQHNVLHGRERRPIRDAVTQDSMYVGASSYARQIEAYLGHFSMDQLHVLTTEELRGAPERSLRGLCRHIGVDWHPQLLAYEPHSNATEGRRGDTSISRLLKRAGFLDPLLERAPRGAVDIGKRLVTRRRAFDSALPLDTVEILREMLASDLVALEGLLGRDLGSWRG
jgi:hypothetical protein